MNRRIKTNSGFIALMSAIIISAVLLLIATNLSFVSFYGRSNILDFEFKERSSALAEACADTALLKLANNPGYTGGETITVSGSEVCTIDSTTPSDPRIFNIHAEPKNYFTNLEIVVNTSDLSVVSWIEVPEF